MVRPWLRYGPVPTTRGLGNNIEIFGVFNISKRCAMDDTQLKDDKACVDHLPLCTISSLTESY